MRNSLRIVLAIVLLVGAACGSRAQSSADSAPSKPLLYTGVTGSIDASGLDDPQYVLSFVPVQRLMLDATQHPLTQAEVERAVAGTPVSLSQLLQLELLRQEGQLYRLNYLLLTLADQKTMYRACARYGQSLADAYRAHQTEFDSLAKKYPNAALRPAAHVRLDRRCVPRLEGARPYDGTWLSSSTAAARQGRGLLNPFFGGWS